MPCSATSWRAGGCPRLPAQTYREPRPADARAAAGPIDRTSLPIPEPKPPSIIELDGQRVAESRIDRTQPFVSRPTWGMMGARRSRTTTKLDFCPFKEFVMGRGSWQSRTTLLRTWVTLHPMAPQQGGPHARYTRLRPARPLLVRAGLLPPHLSTLPGPAHRRRPHRRPPHRLQPPPHRRRSGPRTPLQLSPRPLQTPLVLPATGADLAGFILDRWVPDGPICLAGDDTVNEHRGAKVFGKGCHRDPVPLDAFLHRLSLGAQMGRPGHPGPVPLRRSALGAAGARGAVSQPGEGEGRGREAPPPRSPRTGPRPRPRSEPAAGPRPPPEPRPRPRRPRRPRRSGLRRLGGTRRPRN